MHALVRHINELTFAPVGQLSLIAALYAVAWAVSWVAGRLALRAAERYERADAEHVVLAARRQRETAVSLVQTTVRYVAFVLATFYAILLLSGTSGARALAGASFLVILIGFAAQRFLTDVVAGLLMFFERWFAVGDTILIEPWDIEGVVEEVSLRSIRLRGVDGDVMRVHNSQIIATRLIPSGFREFDVEVYVRDPAEGRAALEEAAAMLPTGPTHFVQRPEITASERLGDELCRLVLHTVVPPGREWLVEDFLPELVKERAGDELVVHGPVAVRVNEQAVRRFARSAAVRRATTGRDARAGRAGERAGRRR